MSLEISMQTTLSIIKSNLLIGTDKHLEHEKKFKDLVNSYVYYRTWERLGRHTFVFSDKLIEGLRNTDIPENFCFNDFYFPYNGFILKSNSGFVGPDVVSNKDFLFKDDFKYIVVIKSEFVDLFSSDIMKDVLPVHIKCNGDFQIMFLAENKGHKNVYDFFFLPISKDSTVKEVVSNPKCSDYPGIQKILNSAVNAVLYINDPTNRENREEREISMLYYPEKKGKKRFERYPVTYLFAPKSFQSNFTGSHGGSINSRFWVRGHWRNQPCGIDKKERKHIWIKPYVKGKNNAYEKQREYRVI